MSKGIPTEYKGYRFRSRLEATWAKFFDSIKWPWQYEPIDLEGYIPDFILEFPWQPLLVEVKPVLVFQEFDEYAPKIEKSGWQHDAIIVGASPFRNHLRDFEPRIGWLSQRELCGDEFDVRGGWGWGGGIMFRCSLCMNISIRHEWAAWNCYFCGGYQGDRHIMPIGPSEMPRLWAKAQNTTQWRAPS